jgi:ATP-dependent Lhr-like helicase
MTYNQLSEPIRKFLYDKGWKQLRPIQIAAIERILSTDFNYILLSCTSSGKTEAAFLPILSKVDFNERGVQILYISPLIALINDQFLRIEELCKYLDINVTKWHGEANRTLKENILKHPNGIILITPESLEALFVNNPRSLNTLFSDLKYVIVDEIHSFIGTDRGVQLKSIISRLQKNQSKRFIIVGLSATISDFDEAKRFTGNELNTKVLVDRTKKKITAHFRFFEQEEEELTDELLEDIYFQTRNSKVLIFPNSRSRAEEMAVKLFKLSEKEKGHRNYFSHHSSVDREIREYVEYFAKNSIRQNYSIACTSTLELGIDIGSVDEVVQIDSTSSVTSLIQRVGRSGRNDGASSNLFLYATNGWQLLQSLACWELYIEGFIEPPQISNYSYDILLHQTLSIVKGQNGIKIKDLRLQLSENYSFNQIDISEIDEIISYLIEINLLEKLRQEIIIGLEGERVVNSHEFYSVFVDEKFYKVFNNGIPIGSIPLSPMITINKKIFLAARIWKILSIDNQAKRINVEKAIEGEKPRYYGSVSDVHAKVRSRMLEILKSNTKYEVLDNKCQIEIDSMRNDFLEFRLNDIEIDRPILSFNKKTQVYTFTSSKINRTINLLFQKINARQDYDETKSMFEFASANHNGLEKWGLISNELNNIDSYLDETLRENKELISFSKWGIFLPQKFQVKLIKEKLLDIPGTTKFINNVRFNGNF